jgi:hypothetical protein
LNNLRLIILILITIIMQSCTKSVYDKKATYYAFLEDQDYYILLKKQPCSLSDKEMVWFKAQLLALKIKSKVSKNREIDSSEKLNDFYSRKINIQKLPTCQIEDLDSANFLPEK